jgi:hypothetical protein
MRKLWRTPSAREPGVTVGRLTTKDGEPARVGERAYDKETRRLAQMGLPQQTMMNEPAPVEPATQLTLFAADTHASPLAWPGTEKARKMTATSGRKCIGSWTRSGPLGFVEKMLLGTSRWASTRCFLTWKPAATPARRLLFRLVPSMPRTDESDCGLWPTPMAQEAKHGTVTDWEMATDHAATENSLRVHVAKKLWQTPVSDDAVERTKGKINSRGEPKLSAEVKLWPTPTGQDAANNGGPSQYQRNSLPLNAEVGGSLNPTWVEWLMGFPEKWTEVD